MVFVDREGYIEDYVFTFVGCVVDQPVASFTFFAGHEVISRICICIDGESHKRTQKSALTWK
jgi:hypothetical protein